MPEEEESLVPLVVPLEVPWVLLLKRVLSGWPTGTCWTWKLITKEIRGGKDVEESQSSGNFSTTEVET